MLRNTILLVALIVFACNNSNPVSPDNKTTSFDTRNYIVLDTIYEHGITSFVGQEIVLKSKVGWDTQFRLILLKMLQQIDSLPKDTLYAAQITLLFPNGQSYLPAGLQNEGRENILLISDSLSKKVNSNLKEEYYFNGKLLGNGTKEYYLLGIFHYRDWLHVTDANLKDTTFIKQSNDVVYWSQTFEFDLKALIEAN